MIQISAFIICKNEEKCISAALASLTWADELVVIDGESTDQTRELARKFTDRIYVRPWTNFGEQRNFALNLATFPWVFYLDADEVCSDQLIQWIRFFKVAGPEGVMQTVSLSPSIHPLGSPRTNRIDMYEIRRLEHFNGRLYKFGANNPSHQWRLFRRQGAHFIGEVHEYPTFEGEIRRLEKAILHFPKKDLEQTFSKMNRYTTLEAEQLFRREVVHRAPYMLFSGAAMFLKSYFRKQGFRDGTLGFILAVLDASSFFLRQAKLYILNKQAGRL